MTTVSCIKITLGILESYDIYFRPQGTHQHDFCILLQICGVYISSPVNQSEVRCHCGRTSLLLRLKYVLAYWLEAVLGMSAEEYLNRLLEVSRIHWT